MIVEKQQIEGFVLLRVEGVIRLGESARFFVQTLERTLHEDQGDVLIDFSKINYIDSTGIGELVGYLARFRDRDRKLVLISPSERIVKLLDVAKLTPMFPTYDSVDEAVEAES